MAKSIEPNIAELANGWLNSYQLDYKLEQEELNSEIDNALKKYSSKGGGKGGNRPDAKLIIKDSKGKYYPILIEYKGKLTELEKLNEQGYIDNINKNYEQNSVNIKKYAVNGAIHYANAVLHYTSYSEIIAIGMTGYKDEQGKIKHEIGVYYVSGKNNYGVGQKIDDYNDFSFLKSANFDKFIKKAKNTEIPPEQLAIIKHEKEQEIDKSLTKLNNEIYSQEKGLGEETRMYLIFAAILATIDNKNNLSLTEENSNIFNNEKLSGGQVILDKIQEFLNERKLPQIKKDFVIKILTVILLDENINRIENGESQLKRVFIKIIDQIGLYYKIGLTTDFTGKLFNEMYNWLGFSQDKLNDVVLTPTYISTLLVKLARIDKDSFVWDFATGSAGLLIAAMNEMLEDAKSIKSPDKRIQKEVDIKAQQLLGIEILPEIYMLAILNMILMGDGSSNILNEDSIKDFKNKEKFPADAFILNPPYSALGNGMVFVQKALDMMNRGYGAIIIQNSAGSGKAIKYNKDILAKHTLIASIKMPVDIFIGKASVQTNIYVFKVGEKHKSKSRVKFIDFSDDGYTRTNRKKASNNLKNTNNAIQRYEELINLSEFGESELNIFTRKEYYEGNIDPENGADWNQSAPIDTKPTLEDFKKTVSDYLSWEVSSILKQRGEEGK
ncbi:MAG: N-6 DNA methylase [Sulfurovum sp.]